MSDHLSRFRAARLRLLAAISGVIAAAALALGLGPVPAVAEEPPTGEASEPFPPYPDVWGRELPYPADGSYYLDQEVFEAPDGRVIVNIAAHPQGSNEFEYRVLDFFSGEMRAIDAKTAYDIAFGGEYKLLHEWRLNLADRGRLRYRSDRVDNCPITYDIHYIEYDRKGKVVADKMLIHLYDRPVRVDVDRHCEISGGRGHFHQNWRQLGTSFAPLKDGTFLAYEHSYELYNGPFIIRFDPDLNSPFIDNQRLFLLDHQVVMDLVDEALALDGPGLQNVDDVIYDYLIKLRYDYLIKLREEADNALAAAVAQEGAVGAARADEAAPFPPYPDVWGRELPYPADGSYYLDQEVFEAPDGRVIVNIAASPQGSNEFEFRVLDFFSGEMRTIDKKISYDIRSGGKHKRLLEWNLNLADGGRLENESHRVSNCTITYDLHFIKYDRKGKIVADKMLIHLYDRLVRVGVNPYCEISGGRAHFYQNWRQIQPAFARLKDGTFLAYDTDGAFVARFDPDLNSPFIDNNRHLFLLDYQVVMDLVDEALARAGSGLQNVNDVIYDYLIELREDTDNAPTPD